MSKPILFEEFVSKKRQRPQENCFKCGKLKDIYTHYNGEDDKPLCNACNMKLRRESPGAIQVKLLKLSGTAIGAMEAMLSLPVEEKQKKTLQDMQDELKLLVRVWLGDTQADEEADDTTPTEEAAGAPTSSASDEFAEERKAAVSQQADNLFEAQQSASASRKNRKALIAAKVEARKTAKAQEHDAEAIAVPNEDITETTPHGYFAKLNRKPKGATQEANPWEVFQSIDAAKPKFCCRERSRQDAEARCWTLDRMAEEEKQNTPTTTNDEAAEAAAM